MHVQFKWYKSGLRVIEYHRMSNLDYSIIICAFATVATNVGYFTQPYERES